MSKCCGCNKKVLSNAVANNTDSCTCSLTDNCTDVCVTPQCGDPKLLTVLVPVIYDEIGINVCRTIPLATLLADYPTAAYIRAEVTNITFATGAAPSVTIKPIAGRPNCYELTLTNLWILSSMSMTVANGCLQPSLSQVLSISLPQQPIRNTMKIPIQLP